MLLQRQGLWVYMYTHTHTHTHTPRGVCPTVAEVVEEAAAGGTGAFGAVKEALLSLAVSPRTRVSPAPPAALSARTRALASLALSLLRCAQVSKETDYRSKRDLLRSKRGLRWWAWYLRSSSSRMSMILSPLTLRLRLSPEGSVSINGAYTIHLSFFACVIHLKHTLRLRSEGAGSSLSSLGIQKFNLSQICCIYNTSIASVTLRKVYTKYIPWERCIQNTSITYILHMQHTLIFLYI